jgi:hypothetical protein
MVGRSGQPAQATTAIGDRRNSRKTTVATPSAWEEKAVAYGHAERNLALLRQLEAETRQLLESLDQPDPEQSAWLQEVTGGGDDR